MNADAKIALARANYNAYVKRDRKALEALLAEDFHFTSPLDSRLDRATYFKRCWPNSERSKSFELIHTAVDGDRVFVTYEGTNKDGHRFRNTEVVTLRGEKVVEVEVYFGWSLPHAAPAGGFVDADAAGKDQQHP